MAILYSEPLQKFVLGFLFFHNSFFWEREGKQQGNQVSDDTELLQGWENQLQKFARTLIRLSH